MVDISIDGDVLSVDVQGLDKLLAFKGRLEIPLAHVNGAYRDPEVVRDWQRIGIKAPGTSVPGVLRAGTFFQDGKRIFWDVHNPDNAIAIELSDEGYDMLIVEVADPASAASLIRSATRRA